MKNLMLLLIAFLTIVSCTKPGTTIGGTIKGGDNLEALLEEIHLNPNATKALGKADVSSGGKFSINIKEGLPAGIYRIRVGAKQATFILNGKEKDVSINADINTLDKLDYQVSGSPTTESFLKTMQGLISGKMNRDQAKEAMLNATDGRLAMVLALSIIGPNPQFGNELKSVSEKMNKDYPGSQDAVDFANYIAQALQANQAPAAGSVMVGQPAPEISFAGPDGKTHSLSSLKGKVVLLDFWASWCGPCRKANPHVVEVYKKYKDQGFTVFSVSLDGVDSRMKAQITPEMAETYMNNAKTAWKNAIEQDGLLWDTHVSDLQKWDSQPAALYGVHAIPQAFVIDKEGKIAAIISPGMDPEPEIKKLL